MATWTSSLVIAQAYTGLSTSAPANGGQFSAERKSPESFLTFPESAGQNTAISGRGGVQIFS